MRYFVHDLESDKLHLHTGGKGDWLALPEADRDAIKRGCLWSKSRNCWVSRAKANKARAYMGGLLERLGFEDRGQAGERRSFGERVEAKQERAEERAERMEERANEAAREVNARFNSPNVETLRGLQGEPVKIGHHSQRRHERLIERADNDMRKGCEALERKAHYQHRAEAARATAEGGQYSNPAFLARRIKEQEAEERLLLRRLEGKFYHYSEPEPISEEYREQLTRALAEVQDKLGFYRHCLETCGRAVFDKASLAGKREVKVRGRWEYILKLNAKTVSVPNTCFADAAAQHRYAMKYPYAEVEDAR